MKRFHLNLDLTSVIVTIAVGVLLPVLLATAVGIVAIVMARDVGGIVTGVLVISFAVTALGSALITVVLTGRKARLARRQADFVANVSHELRTPLSAIRLYAQTLQSGKLADDPEASARCVATILREAAWLDTMIDGVLTWRASSRDVLPLDMVAAPIAGAVNEAVARFRGMVEADELNLTVATETRLAARHDARALNVVVLNLLTNAYKYTGVDKRIRVTARDADACVEIAVSDNGIGLDPKEAKHIFEPFYRVQSGRESASGAGLGLAIVHYLVGSHGGTIDVSSEPGKATTFTVRLPACLEQS